MRTASAVWVATQFLWVATPSQVVAAIQVADASAALQVIGQYPRPTGPGFLVIHPDSLGLMKPLDVDSTEFNAYLSSKGLPFARIMPGGSVLAVAPDSSTPSTLFSLVREMVSERPDLVLRGGPLAFFAGTSELPVVLVEQLVVTWRSGVSEAQIDSLGGALSLFEIHRSTFTPARRLYGLSEGAGEILSVVQATWDNPLTLSAYPNFHEGMSPASGNSYNSSLADQWHLDITQTLDAWSFNNNSGSPEVVVAVIELSGFDTAHPNLYPNLWENPSELHPPNTDDDDDDDNPPNGCDDDVNGCDFRCPTSSCSTYDGGTLDLFSTHGTQVAGLIAAAQVTGNGISGVCPGCRLMLISADNNFEALTLAFEYAVMMGASVINGSWVKVRDPDLDKAIMAAARERPNFPGIPVVMAAGNSAGDKCLTAFPNLTSHPSLPEVLSVSASDNFDLKILASGSGACLDLVAPGGFDNGIKPPIHWGITTTDPTGTPGFNNDNLKGADCPRTEAGPADLGHTNCFGRTSAATAIVSGVIGLMLSENPDLTRTEIYDILRTTADKVHCPAGAYTPDCTDPYAHSDTYGYGRVNALAAVKAAQAAKPTTVLPSIELGVRAGYTKFSGTGSPSRTNAPGGGPNGAPVFHLAFFPGASPHWMLELQAGAERRSQGTTDSKQVATAGQASYFIAFIGSGILYLGGSYAYLHSSGGSTTTAFNDSGPGAHIGFRWAATSDLALRVEGRYRRWYNRGINEWGVSFGFGVRLR